MEYTMSMILLEAESRTAMGKGASRRLRRLENKVPAIIYGGDKSPTAIHFLQHKLMLALESEKIYSSVFDISVDGKVEHVILKAVQRHPYKKIVFHIDLQRVSSKDILVKLVPLHFINEEQAPGVKAGGLVSHVMTQLEIRCQAKDLPEFIEVDLSNVKINESLHLSELKLPKGVQLTVNCKDASHDAPVVSIHKPKTHAIEEVEVPAKPADVPTHADEENPPTEE
jgi:large subunit ribosomal protein L25